MENKILIETFDHFQLIEQQRRQQEAQQQMSKIFEAQRKQKVCGNFPDDLKLLLNLSGGSASGQNACKRRNNIFISIIK